MMIVIILPFNRALGPWSPILLLNHHSRPYGERHNIFGSIFVIFGLSFYYHFMMFIIITYTNQWSINYWHYASKWAVKQHSYRMWGVLAQAESFVSASGLCVDHSLNQNISLVCTLQILCMPPLVHYSDGEMMMRMPVLCYRLLQKVLNLSETKLLQESDIIFIGIPYSAKIIYMFILSCLLIGLLSS